MIPRPRLTYRFRNRSDCPAIPVVVDHPSRALVREHVREPTILLHLDEALLSEILDRMVNLDLVQARLVGQGLLAVARILNDFAGNTDSIEVHDVSLNVFTGASLASFSIIT